MIYIILAFIMGFLTDIVWTRYSANVSKSNAVYAANWSVLIYLFGVYATYLLIDKEYIPMVAFAIGGWIGTYFAVIWGK